MFFQYKAELEEAEEGGVVRKGKDRDRVVRTYSLGGVKSRRKQSPQTKASIDRREKKGTPLVSIIIPVYNNLELTCQCLRSIHDNTEDDYEIIVVDNASQDGTANYLRDTSYRVIRNEENLGFPKAINQGVEVARGRFVCLLNNDTRLLPGWLSPMIECLSQQPQVGMVGPKQIDLRGEIWHAGIVLCPDSNPSMARIPCQIYWGLPHDDPLTNVERDYPAMNFACILIRRELFEQVGSLDENFVFPGTYEDVDWCIRMRKIGYSCRYLPTSKIIHAGSVTQYKTSDEMRKVCLEGSRINNDYYLEKWKDEPEDLFVPKDLRGLIEEYYNSPAFYFWLLETGRGRKYAGRIKLYKYEVIELMGNLIKENIEREIELDRAIEYADEVKEHAEEFEMEIKKNKELNSYIKKYVVRLEAEEQAKGDELDKAREYADRLEQEIKLKAVESDKAYEQIGELENLISQQEAKNQRESQSLPPSVSNDSSFPRKLSYYLKKEGLLPTLKRSFLFIGRRLWGKQEG